MSNSDLRRLSQAPPSSVTLHCSCCDAQLGTFDNVWIRLASAYARARVQGKHIGTEIGKKVKIVPPGEAQKAAEGCGLAEVFCTGCLSLVGQYCKTAPDAERQALIGHYFYKMSRTYLKDARTSEVVEPIYGYGSGLNLASSRPTPSDASRTGMGFDLRQSQTSVAMDHSGKVSLVSQEPNRSKTVSISSKDMVLSLHESGQKDMLERLASLERKVSDHTAAMAEFMSLQATVDLQATLIQEMQTQILKLFAQDLRFSQSPSQADNSAVAGKAGSELDALRQENRELKAKFATILSAMGGAAANVPEQGNPEAVVSSSSSQPTSHLGKRKRGEFDLGGPDYPIVLGPQKSRLPLQAGEQVPQNLEDSLLTPHSTQGSREVSTVPGFFQNYSPIFDPSHETDAPTEGFRYRDNASADSSGLINSAPSIRQTKIAVAEVTEEDEIVQFSDDDMTGLHLPTAELVPPKRLTIQQYRATNNGACDDSGRESPINLDQAQHFTPDDIRKQIEEEALPKPPKEPVEPKERVQSTEKYLNAELEELGLTEWIGKDKKNAEFRAVIDAARTAHREAKKKEALARKGLRPAPMALSKPQPVEVAAVPEKATTNKSTKPPSTRNRRSRMTTEPLAEITNQQEKKAAKPVLSGRVGRPRKKATTAVVRDSEEADSEQEVDSGAENALQVGVMTRRQQRESDIRKRDQMAQEAMEMEEA